MSHLKCNDCHCGLAFKDPTLNLKPQKPRTIFTFEQLKNLEKTFMETTYPTADQRQSLAMSLHLSDERIRVWFQNRRAKEKRLKEERLAMSLNLKRKESPLSLDYQQARLQPLDIPAFLAKAQGTQSMQSLSSIKSHQPLQSSRSQQSQQSFQSPRQLQPLQSITSLQSHQSLHSFHTSQQWQSLHQMQNHESEGLQATQDAELSPRAEEELVRLLLRKAKEKEQGKRSKKQPATK